jgi:hypothetical protein
MTQTVSGPIGPKHSVNWLRNEEPKAPKARWSFFTRYLSARNISCLGDDEREEPGVSQGKEKGCSERKRRRYRRGNVGLPLSMHLTKGGLLRDRDGTTQARGREKLSWVEERRETSKFHRTGRTLSVHPHWSLRKAPLPSAGQPSWPPPPTNGTMYLIRTGTRR